MKDIELVKHIYKDCDMSISSLNKLEEKLENKDNKIKGTVSNIKKGYERYKELSLKIIKKDKSSKEENSIFDKMMANMGIAMEVKKDNSDASIADMLIKGILMGESDMEKVLNSYEKLDKKYEALAKDFINFQKDNIEELKKHL